MYVLLDLCAQKSAINAVVRPPQNLCKQQLMLLCKTSICVPKPLQNSTVRYSPLLPRFPCPILLYSSLYGLPYSLAVRPPCLENRAKYLPFTVLSQLYGLAENVLLKCCLGKCAELLPPPHCPEISLALLLSFSQSTHEIMNDLFLLFLL